MKKYLFHIVSAMLLTACVATPYAEQHAHYWQSPPHYPASGYPQKQPENHIITQQQDLGRLIDEAEQFSTGRTRAVLLQGRYMTLIRPEIIKGGCWDYLDAAWTRAGVPREARKVVFKSQRNGAYAQADWLRAGDWIYHINYGYNNLEHSGMFIGWVDKSQHLGLTLSYAGGHRNEPARYRVYDLSGVYQITRAE